MILSNTSSLSNYLQGKGVGVITAKRNADLTSNTLLKCRNENNFELLWERAQIISNEMKTDIKGSRFEFKEAREAQKKLSRRLQAPIGESTYTACVLKGRKPIIASIHSTYSLDKEILCALGDVLNDSLLENSFDVVTKFSVQCR
jgi:hypothetical protein